MEPHYPGLIWFTAEPICRRGSEVWTPPSLLGLMQTKPLGPCVNIQVSRQQHSLQGNQLCWIPGGWEFECWQWSIKGGLRKFLKARVVCWSAKFGNLWSTLWDECIGTRIVLSACHMLILPMCLKQGWASQGFAPWHQPWVLKRSGRQTGSTYLLHGQAQRPQNFPRSVKFFSASFISLLIWSIPSSMRSSCSD